MSSVVNKSKNKFAPKAKVRPRSGATPARSSQEPSQTPEPSRQPSSSRPVSPILQRAASVAVSQSDVSESEREGPDRSSVAPKRRDSSEVPRLVSLSRHASEEIPAPGARALVPVVEIPTSRSRSQDMMEIEVSGSRSLPQAAMAIQIPMARSRRSPEPGSQRIEIPSARQFEIPMPAARSQPISEVREVTAIENREPGGNAVPEARSAVKPPRKARARKPPAEGKATKGRGKKRQADSQDEGPGEGEEEDENERGEVSYDEGSEYEEEGGGEAKQPSKTGKPRKKKRKAAGPRKARPRKARAESPGDGEERRIEESVMKMKDLIKDPRIGRKSKRYVELAQMDWGKIVREQRAARAEIQARKEAGEDIHEETMGERLDKLAHQQERDAPQMRVVNGQIVLDEESLQIDRHQTDMVEESLRTMEVVEEDRNTRIINSGTFGKRERVEKWGASSTERFFEGLSMFGTDFELISRLFPGRSRRQMKNKFNAEERKNPRRITEALRTRAPLDMAEYSEISGLKFNDPALLEQELEQIREQQEAQDAAAKEHRLQTERERQEQANAAMREDAANAAAGLSGVDVQPKRKNKKAEREAARSNEQVLEMSIEEYEARRQREREREEENRWY